MASFETEIAGRKDQLQRRARKPGLTLQQKLAGAALILGLAGYAGYAYLGASGTPLAGARDDTFARQGTTRSGRMVVGAETETPPEEEAQRIFADGDANDARPAESADPEDLKRLRAELEEKNAALTEAESARTAFAKQVGLLEDQIAALEKNLAQFGRLSEDRLKQELALIESRYQTEISTLKAQLAIAEANTVVVDDEEQKKRLEAQRLLDQQRIQSQGVIFDNSSEARPGLRY